MSAEFKIKRWDVQVLGHAPVQFYATTRGKAQAKAFRAYQAAYDQCTFREFLTRSRVVRTNVVPASFGKPIKVSGKPAFMIERAGGNSLRFVWPGEDQILTSHLLDTTETT